MRTSRAVSTHCTSTAPAIADAQRWCNALLVLSLACALPRLLAPSKHANRSIFARINEREAQQAAMAKAHDAARVAVLDAEHKTRIAANVADERKRASLAVIVTLANECAARSCGAWIDTRLRGAIKDACALHALPTLSGIPHELVSMPIPQAKTEAAIAALAFAHQPSVANWIATDRALAQLTRSLADAADKRPERLLSETAPACDRAPPPVYRVHSDDVNQLHSGSAGVSKIKPGACPPTYAGAADKRERRALRAKRIVDRLLATSIRYPNSPLSRKIRACWLLASD